MADKADTHGGMRYGTAMSIDFSRNAGIYDRRHGRVVDPDLVRKLVEAAGLKPGQPVLDLASGTGRVALGLARAGFDVTATDISADMLGALAAKADGTGLRTRVVEGIHLPFADDSQSAVTLARVLYLVRNWRGYLAEIDRIAAPQGVILHEWGNGDARSPWVRYRERLREALAALGHADAFHPGARTEGQVEARLRELGWTRAASVPSGPGTPMTLGDFIRMVETGEASYLWHVPVEIAAHVVEGMRVWATDTLGELGQRMELPGDARWRIYRRTRLA